jgi:hypothetical protein
MFALEQGIKSPRDGTVTWQTYEVYDTRAQAMKEAKRSKGMWRIVESKVVWTNVQETSDAGE